MSGIRIGDNVYNEERSKLIFTIGDNKFYTHGNKKAKYFMVGLDTLTCESYIIPLDKDNFEHYKNNSNAVAYDPDEVRRKFDLDFVAVEKLDNYCEENKCSRHAAVNQILERYFKGEVDPKTVVYETSDEFRNFSYCLHVKKNLFEYVSNKIGFNKGVNTIIREIL